jgi:hypothetical protein
LLAIDNCRGHRPKQRTNPTFVSLLCPGKLLAQRAAESFALLPE